MAASSRRRSQPRVEPILRRPGQPDTCCHAPSDATRTSLLRLARSGFRAGNDLRNQTRAWLRLVGFPLGLVLGRDRKGVPNARWATTIASGHPSSDRSISGTSTVTVRVPMSRSPESWSSSSSENLNAFILRRASKVEMCAGSNRNAAAVPSVAFGQGGFGPEDFLPPGGSSLECGRGRTLAWRKTPG